MAELRAISSNAGDYLIALEKREREASGIATLKVGYNRVHGYFIEISKGQAKQTPAHYIRRQTLKNAERYITPELKDYEDKALSAKSRALTREKTLYESLIDKLNDELASLQQSANAIAELDVLVNLAERAETSRYLLTCDLAPTLVDALRNCSEYGTFHYEAQAWGTVAFRCAALLSPPSSLSPPCFVTHPSRRYQVVPSLRS